MVGAEMPMTSDQVIWSEQNRLHIAYNDVEVTDAAANELQIPSNLFGAQNEYIANVISVNQTIVIMNPATGVEVKAIVTSTGANDLTSDANNGFLVVAPYTVDSLDDLDLARRNLLKSLFMVLSTEKGPRY
jgi:hypothetical protein